MEFYVSSSSGFSYIQYIDRQMHLIKYIKIQTMNHNSW